MTRGGYRGSLALSGVPRRIKQKDPRTEQGLSVTGEAARGDRDPPRPEQQADFVLDELNSWPVYEHNTWTVWIAEKQVRPI
jgi:hypothetical protein